MRITLQRTGGPIPTRSLPGDSAAVDTTTLPSDAAAELESLARSASQHPPAPPPDARHAPGAFTYEVTIEDGGAPVVLVASDADMPDAMRALVRRLTSRAPVR